MSSNSFGRRVKNRLAQMNVSQRDLAEAVGMDPPQISRILSGKSKTGLETIVRMAEYLVEPEEEYLRLYSGLEPTPNTDPIVERIVVLVEKLSPEDKSLFLEMAEFFTRKHIKAEGIANEPREANIEEESRRG